MMQYFKHNEHLTFTTKLTLSTVLTLFAGKQNRKPEKFYVCYLRFLQIVISRQHRLNCDIGEIPLRPISPQSKAKGQSYDDLEIYQLTGSESGNGPEMTLNFINRKKNFQIETRNNKSFLLNIFKLFVYLSA